MMNNTITTKIRKVTFLMVAFVLTLSNVSFGQQTNNWYFGSAGCTANTGMRLNFTTGGTFLSTGYPLMTQEGSSAISDATGAPLFYTDGTDAWEASGNTKFNTFSLGGGSSSTQSAIILPKPGTTNQWLVFTVDVNGNNGASYVTVQRTGAAPGTFSVVEAARVVLVGAGVIGEGLCIIGSTKAASNSWVIVRDRSTTGQIRAFEITSAGAVITAPVLSTMSGTGFTNTNYDQYIGIIKSNTCQNKLAFTYYNNDADLVGFDPSTGRLKAGTAKRILNPTGAGLGHSYGVEFSPNDKYLYLTALDEGKVFQYDTTVTTNRAVEMIDITEEAGQLQLAPDGKIYMARMNGTCPAASYLSTINSPNGGATFTANAVNLTSVTNGSGNIGGSFRGLPTFTKSLVANSLFAQPGDVNVCINTNIPLSYVFGGFVASTSWAITPGVAGVDWSYVTGTSTSAAPTIRFLVAGTYTVTPTVTDNCANVYTDPMIINASAPKIPAGTISCNTGSITLTATGTVTADYPNYTWYDAATGGNIIGTGSPVTLNYADIANTPTSVWVEVAGSVTTGTSGSGTIGMANAGFNWGNNPTTYGPVPFTVLASSLTLKSFIVQAGTNGGSNFDVEIKNGAGTVVFLKTYTAGANSTATTVNINTDFPAGNYVITLKNTTIAWRGGTWAGATNAGQIYLPTYGTANTYGLANFIYDYKNTSVTTTCSNRVKVDRKCLTVLPGDGTYCTNNDIPLSYTFEGTATARTWTITPGVLGTDWTYVTGTSTSAAPTIRFLTAGTYTVSVAVTDVSTVVYTKSMTLTVIAGGVPAGTISCSAPNIIFTATGAVPADYSKYIWYDAATGGNIYGVGSPVTWNNPDNASSPTSVWVELGASASSSAPVTNVVGPAPAWLNGSSYQYNTRFDVLADHVTLNSFQLRPDAWPAGSCPSPTNISFTIEIRNAANTVVFLKPYSATVACGALISIPTSADLVKGTGYTLSLLSFASNAGSFYQIYNGFPVTQAGVATVNGPASNYTVVGNLSFTSNNFTVTHNCNSRVKIDRLCSLPVELISFSGVSKGGKNVLTWITTAEINNDYFEVQRSSDGINFVTLGRVKGHGNTITVNEYEFIDAAPSSGINYYRLVQTDYDGQKSTSAAIKIYTGFTNASSFVVSPNPSTESFGINFLDLSGGEITVIDLLGKELITKTIEAGTDKIELGAEFAKGAYVIRFSGASGISTQLIIKE